MTATWVSSSGWCFESSGETDNHLRLGDYIEGETDAGCRARCKGNSDCTAYMAYSDVGVDLYNLAGPGCILYKGAIVGGHVGGPVGGHIYSCFVNPGMYCSLLVQSMFLKR